jgi:hypothetical protein
MNTVLTLDGHMNFGGETPEEGMYVQVNEHDAEVVEVDEEERVVSVVVYDGYENEQGELRHYSY